MHCHQSLWKAGKNIFYDKKGYGLISDTARYYIGGLIKHAHALCAFIAPTTNSYRRLVPGYEAPINLVYSARNRSACVRIPMDNIRGVIGCPVAGLTPNELFDASAVVRDFTQLFLGNKDYTNLPRKFNVTITGCKEACTHAEAQDIAMQKPKRCRTSIQYPADLARRGNDTT